MDTKNAVGFKFKDFLMVRLKATRFMEHTSSTDVAIRRSQYIERQSEIGLVSLRLMIGRSKMLTHPFNQSD